VTLCRCGQCRKAQGCASASAPATAEGFSVVRGAATIVEYVSSPGKKRAFCGVCGSPLYSRRDSDSQVLRLRLGALDEPPPSLRIEAEIFVADAPQWSYSGHAPRYAGFEPGRR